MKNFVNYALLCSLIPACARVHRILLLYTQNQEQRQPILTIFAKFFLSLVSQFVHFTTRAPFFALINALLVKSSHFHIIYMHIKRRYMWQLTQIKKAALTNQLYSKPPPRCNFSVQLTNNSRWKCGHSKNFTHRHNPTPQNLCRSNRIRASRSKKLGCSSS